MGEKENLYMRQYMATPQGKAKKRGYRYKAMYGISLEEYNTLLKNKIMCVLFVKREKLL